MPLVISGVIILLVLFWLMLEYSVFIPAGKGIPVLMYHKISKIKADGLSVPEENFEKQLEYISSKGYHPISFTDLLKIQDSADKLPSRPVILTFDDAYTDFAERALPVLKKFNFKVTVFIPVGYMGNTNVWDNGSDRIMTVEQIQAIAHNENVEFGMHSFLHNSYNDMNLDDMREDLENCSRTLSFHKIPFVNVLAYPYGSYPKHDKLLNREMKNLFHENGLKFALRIGNRINSWPLKDPYEMKRIDIKGTDTFTTFKIKLSKGRKKLFS